MKTTDKEYLKLKLQTRLNTLLANGKNAEGEGVCRKLERQLRNLK